MNKLMIGLFLSLTLCGSVAKAQNTFFGKEFSIGVAPLYGADIEEGPMFGFHYFQEFITNTHFNARLSKNWFVGVRSHLIHVRQRISPKYSETFTFNGLFAQYSIIASNRVRVSFELSYSYGDYCSCEPNQPLYGENLFYLGYGVTADFQFLKKHPGLWLNVGMHTHHINGYYESHDSKIPLNPSVLIGQYTRPILGIQYKFGDKTVFTKK